jgi:pimeloyl-ACP methyl ester carboxylesterase
MPVARDNASSAMQESVSTALIKRHTASTPRLAFSLTGPADAPCVALLHGVGSSSDTWSELRPHLPPEFRYLAPDYRGHGASETGRMPYALDDFAADHFRLLDELGIGAVHIVGFSIGAIFAQAIARARPERTRSLVLLNSIGGRSAAERQRAQARLDVIRSIPPAEIAAASLARWFTADFLAARPDLAERERSIIAANDPAPYAASYAVLATTDELDCAHRIAVPTLIVTGELDEGSTPEMSRKLNAAIAGSRLHIRPSLKHYLHIEDAEAIGALITGFLREVA